MESLRAAWRSDAPVRIVGRKNEPALRNISAAIENSPAVLQPEVEVLMRVALELERGEIIEDALKEPGLVGCDRGLVSLVSWFEYLGVCAGPFRTLLEKIEARYHVH